MYILAILGFYLFKGVFKWVFSTTVLNLKMNFKFRGFKATRLSTQAILCGFETKINTHHRNIFGTRNMRAYNLVEYLTRASRCRHIFQGS